MKKFVMISLATVLAALPGLASATHWESVDLTVDCDGWNAQVVVYYGGPRAEAEAALTIVLTDETGAEVGTASWAQTIYRTSDAALETYTITGGWVEPPCGVLTARGVFEITTPLGDTDRFVTDTKTATATMDCDCDDPGGEYCNFTPGFWKTHPEAWPVLELELGGVVMSQAELLEIMFTPVRGDATIILAKHLIAAKLNVLSGSNDDIVPTIEQADQALEEDPVGSKPRRRARVRALSLKNILADYNELGCPGIDDDAADPADKSFLDEDSTTWGGLKADYR